MIYKSQVPLATLLNWKIIGKKIRDMIVIWQRDKNNKKTKIRDMIVIESMHFVSSSSGNHNGTALLAFH